MTNLNFNNFKIEFKNNKYNLKDIFNIFNYDYEEYFNTSESIYYSKEELIEFLTEENERELKDFISNHDPNKLLTIFEFIEENNLEFKLGNWFKDLWFPLFEEKEILITNNILEFIMNYNNISGPGPNRTLDYRQKNNQLKELLSNNQIIYDKITYKDIQNNYKYYIDLIQDDIKSITPNNLTRKTWVLITVDDFKEFLMCLNTKFGKEIRKYYLQLEKIFYEYSKYISNYNLKIKTKELKQLKDENITLKDENITVKEENNNLKIQTKTLENFVDNVKTKNKNGYIYIATSRRYASQNIFKVGRTDNLKSRLSSYNTNKPINDRFYFCFYFKTYNSNKVETIINDLLDDFKDKNGKEIIILHFTYLKEIIELVINNINETYEFLNNLIKNKIFKENLKPLIPDELNVENEELIINEIRKEIYLLLDDAIKRNNLNLTRKELLNRLNLENINKVQLWNHLKTILNWSNSRTPINYNNRNLIIAY